MIHCTGWWQQNGYGRQSMDDLKLDFAGPTFVGQGHDIIAEFTIAGKVRADGSVEILKQYHNRHSVLYVGQYDGEGTMCGKWDISGYQGLWSIHFSKQNVVLTDDQIQELG